MFLAEDVTAGIFCAVKAIKHQKLNGKTWREVEVEKSVLARAWESPYLAHLYSTFTSPVSSVHFALDD